jgi:hypothetical protein
MGRVRWAGRSGEVPHLTPTLSAPKGGEGDFQLSSDRFQYSIKVFHHIGIPEADYAIAAPRNL